MGRTFRAAVTSTAVLALTLAFTSGEASSATARLSSELISATQMPKGWSVTNPTGSVQAGCLSDVVGLSHVLFVKGIKQSSSAKIFFEDNQSIPAAAEMLTTYADATLAYTKIVASLNACKHVSGDILGKTVTGTMKTKVFAHYGNESQAFTANTLIMGNKIDVDVLIARKGNVIVGVMEGGLPGFSVHQFQGLIAKAVAKIH